MSNMKILQVEDNPGLVRDAGSNSILNVDTNAYDAHKRNRRLAQAKLEKEHAQESRINKLENDVSELKSGISQILEMLKK